MMEVHVSKTVPIEFRQVVAAYKKVRKGGKAVGIDEESWKEFARKTERNLYVIWNRLASGSYHPQAVREVEIPKKDGKKRKLGIPTLRDRIAQQVVKDYMEKRIDKLFHKHSYGYRPLKSTHQAVEQVRQNCYQNDWVIDLDISKFFDEIDHELMKKAVGHIIEDKWVLMYVERWLTMPIIREDGEKEERKGKGTPQGGVISPILANLYLHYALDIWLEKNYPEVSFVRYADDIIIHCKSKQQSEEVLEAVEKRIKEVRLSINVEKTSIAYCKDYRRKAEHDVVRFEFLGFSFQPRGRKSTRDGKLFTAFAAEISQSNQKRIRGEINEAVKWRNTRMEVAEIASILNSRIRGWIGYYGVYSKKSLRRTLLSIDYRVIKWLRNKHKLNRSASIEKFLQMKKQNPKLFYHWEAGYG